MRMEFHVGRYKYRSRDAERCHGLVPCFTFASSDSHQREPPRREAVASCRSSACLLLVARVRDVPRRKAVTSVPFADRWY
jgi:hypothetical protein